MHISEKKKPCFSFLLHLWFHFFYFQKAKASHTQLLYVIFMISDTQNDNWCFVSFWTSGVVYDCTGLVVCNFIAWSNVACLVFLTSCCNHLLAPWSKKRGRVHKSLPGGFMDLQVMTHTVPLQGIPGKLGTLQRQVELHWLSMEVGAREVWCAGPIMCGPSPGTHHCITCSLAD